MCVGSPLQGPCPTPSRGLTTNSRSSRCDVSWSPTRNRCIGVRSSKRDFLSFPVEVKEDMGNALGIAQFGGTAPTAKPWKGLGPGVLEIAESHDGNAYRAVYTVRFAKAVYVLHAFQKKSPSGITDGQAGCRSHRRTIEVRRE